MTCEPAILAKAGRKFAVLDRKKSLRFSHWRIPAAVRQGFLRFTQGIALQEELFRILPGMKFISASP